MDSNKLAEEIYHRSCYAPLPPTTWKGWAFMIVLFAAIVALAYNLTPTDGPYKSFAAWEKLTGNPNHLTFEEWQYLPRESRRGR